ncbi:MAG: biotin--[acetyl-CoA-carboxylase] ligase [Erysipelothrix sp.]|nr:biotin--[acetyl-CoA-carboxylase] ligase [Erysipelothrix sp.]
MDFKLFKFDSVNSTNELAKSLVDATTSPFLVVADRQSSGKGTMGKSFYSPEKKGIYMTLSIQPNLGVDAVQNLSIDLAGLISEYINKLYDINTNVKHPNDIIYNGKKLAGILIEASYNMELQSYDSILIGIGINLVHDDLIPDDLKDIYLSLDMITPLAIDKDSLIEAITHLILKHLEDGDRYEINN